jgi:diadenosine tetraphosphate (Ap4A) HIT family hydrolase
MEESGAMEDCVFCERTALRRADIYIENEWCVYASSRDPADPPDVLPGSGIIVPKAHRPSTFDLTAEEWVATHDLLLKAKAIQDERLAPDGYFLCWSPYPASAEGVSSMHAHLHVVPRFDDEPLRDRGGRVGIKGDDNIRPDPSAPGSGRATLFGRPVTR